MTLFEEIKRFFAAYIDAFTRRDADALSEHWDPIALFPAPTGNFSMERLAFRNHCVTLMEFYRQQGVTRIEGDLLSAVELFPNVAQARMAYRMYGDGDEMIAGWEHVYILRRGDHWRVSLTIPDGEMAAWAARGAQP
jgi:ketosteroid isomerase-like protein